MTSRVREFLGCFGGLLALTLAGCSTVKPMLGPEPSVDSTYQTAPTLPNAVQVAWSMKTRYSEKVENQIVWERFSGLGMIGLTVLAADFAMRGVASSELIGMGVAGGGIYAASNWLVSKPQQYIYAAGANAVQCAVDTMQPLILIYPRRDKLAELASRIRMNADGLDATLKADYAQSSGLSNVKRARAVVDRARAFLPVANQAVDTLDGAGAQLRSSLSRIQDQLTTAVVANAATLQSLLDALGSALPATGFKAIGVALPGVPIATTNVKSSGRDGDLAEPVKALEAWLAEAEAIVDRVRATPPESILKQCNVNLQQSGLAMSVIPAEWSVEQGKTAGFKVVGGALPYQPPSWIGPRPPIGQVDLQLESGLGVVTVTAKANAEPGTYTLLLLDNAKGRETVPLVIKPSTTAALTKVVSPAVVATGNEVCTKVVRVEKVQQALVKQGTKSVKVGGVDKPLVADGCLGTITRQAMQDYYKSQIGGQQMHSPTTNCWTRLRICSALRNDWRTLPCTFLPIVLSTWQFVRR